MIISYPNGNQEYQGIYEWKSGSVTVAGTAANTDLKTQAGFTTLFDKLKGNTAYKIRVDVSGNINIRLNDATNDSILVTPTTPYIDDFCEINRIFVSTGGVAVTLTIRLK